MLERVVRIGWARAALLAQDLVDGAQHRGAAAGRVGRTGRGPRAVRRGSARATRTILSQIWNKTILLMDVWHRYQHKFAQPTTT